MRDRLQWVGLPDARDDEAVQAFAMTYAGYELHGPDQGRLHSSLRHVIDLDTGRLRTVDVPTEDLRAALFALGRQAAHGWDSTSSITRQPATHLILDELHRRIGRNPLVVLASSSGLEVHGHVQSSGERIHDSISEVMLESALALVELDPDRLAWLAMTSKAEHALRDEWGWRLHRSLPGLAVTREWQRADLAILDGTVPLALVEGKAIYGFDALSASTRARYVSLVTHDLAKCAALAPDAYAIASVLISTVESPWSEAATPSVAYSAGNRRTASLGAGTGESAVLKMFDALSTLGAVGVVDLGIGSAFGASVDSKLLLVRPRPSSARETLGDG